MLPPRMIWQRFLDGVLEEFDGGFVARRRPESFGVSGLKSYLGLKKSFS